MMGKMKKTGRIAAGLLLAVALVVGYSVPAAAATARATTMKLEKTTGTVTVKTANGTARGISDGMRLYNGYSVRTASSSYAYVSLDTSKAVKLDQKTCVVLRQKSKKLELFVKSGKLFFNVKNPLAADESMNVRTSTMVTGVRGTCGVVEAGDDSSTLYLIEGTVSYTVTDRTTGEQKDIEVHGGEKITMTKDGGADGVKVSELSIGEIPLMALEEVRDDPQLQAKIEATTNLKVSDMITYLEQQTDGSQDDGTSGGTENPDQSGNAGSSSSGGSSGSSSSGGSSWSGSSGSSWGGSSGGSWSGSSGGSSSGGSSSDGSSGGSSGGTETETPASPDQPQTDGDGGSQEILYPDDFQYPDGSYRIVSGASLTAEDIGKAFQETDCVVVGRASHVQVTTGQALEIQSGKRLVVFPDSGINVSDGGKLVTDAGACLENYGVLVLSDIPMYNSGKVYNYDNAVVTCADGAGGKSSVENMGTGQFFNYTRGVVSLDGFQNRDNAELINHGIIELKENYAGSGGASYSCNGDGVLCSGKDSEGTESGLLLLTVSDGNGMRYYSESYNMNVQKLLEENNVSQFDLNKDMILWAGQTHTLESVKITQGEYALLVSGTLELNNVELCGTGKALIRILPGGTLRLTGNGGKKFKLENLTATDSDRYLIAMDEEPAYGGTEDSGAGRIEWEDTTLKLEAYPEKAIGGVTVQQSEQNSDQFIVLLQDGWENRISLPENYMIVGNDNQTWIAPASGETSAAGQAGAAE